MARCWRCGTAVSAFRYKCPACETVEKVENLGKGVTAYLQKGSEQISQLSDEISNIASLLEWGFEELSWQLEQQTEVLRSIDITLKTPIQTQAKEWRQIAEELRTRGVVVEAKGFFLKALEAYPLDYRTYVGLGHTYLLMNMPNEARDILEKSVPHAPKQTDFDYKSYSYRLIGHIYFCQEKYAEAVKMTQSAVELSPSYYHGYYDHAQYCAQTQDEAECLSSLKVAIDNAPSYYYLAEKEKNFDPLRKQVGNLLSEFYQSARGNAERCLSEAGSSLKQAEDALTHSKGFRERYEKAKKMVGETSDSISDGDENLRESSESYERAGSKFQKSSQMINLKNYVSFLQGGDGARESGDMAIKARDLAYGAQKDYDLGYQHVLSKTRWDILKSAGMGFVYSFFPFLMGLLITRALGINPWLAIALLIAGPIIGLVLPCIRLYRATKL